MRHHIFDQDTHSKSSAMLTLCILLLSLCGLCTGYYENPDTQSCPNHGKFMDDNTRYKILYYHEGTRNVLALGESPGYQTGFLPPAKNLFKLRWNCTLEAKARKRTQDCAHSDKQMKKFGKNVYYGPVPEVTSTKPIDLRKRKYDFISKSIDEWLLPTENYPIQGDVSYKESLYGDSKLYTFANLAYDKIYEVGCNYEECGTGKVPDHAPLYQVGDKDPDHAGCNKDNTVCQFLGKPEATCDDLLCKLPNVVSSFL
ncbi:SCP-like protein [Cooperia oncophora]